MATITPSHGNGSITPWMPGESGNPTGRAAGSLYPSEALRMLSAASNMEDIQAIVDDKVWRGRPAHPMLIATARQLLKACEDGKLDALEFIADRLDGKPIQTQRIGTEEDVRKVYHIDAAHHDGLPDATTTKRVGCDEVTQVVGGEGVSDVQGDGVSETPEGKGPPIGD